MVREPDATMQPTPQDHQLMSKHRVPGFEPQPRLEWRGQGGKNEAKQPDHSAGLGDSITSSTRMRFSVHTMGLGVSLVMESDIGASFAGLVYRELHDERGPSRVDFYAHWRGDNENPALKRFLSLLAERYPSPPPALGVRPARLAFANPRSVAMKRASIGAISLAGSMGCPLSRVKASA
jgi:DNA-binding transcriptional LysR family regulator